MSTETNVQRFLTREEVAGLFRSHPRTVKRREASAGFPKPIQFGGKVLYDRASIERWIASRMASVR